MRRSDEMLQNANASAASTKVEADKAKAEADKAKAEADKLLLDVQFREKAARQAIAKSDAKEKVFQSKIDRLREGLRAIG